MLTTFVEVTFVLTTFVEVTFVLTTLVEVTFVLYNAPVVTDVVIFAVPDTSNVFEGFVVPIPTLPPVVKILPRVFELLFADNC